MVTQCNDILFLIKVQVRTMEPPATGAPSSLTRWFSISLVGQFSESLEFGPVTPNHLSCTDSLSELLDGSIMFYNIAAHKQLYKVTIGPCYRFY